MNPGLHLSRRLEQLLPGVIGKRYRKLLFANGEIVPTMADLQAGAAEVVRDRIGEVGDAAILADKAADIPLVDLEMGEDRYRAFMIAAGISYSMQEMRAIEFSGNANMISSRRLSVANRVIEEKDNSIAAFGDSRMGFTGFLNNASVTVNNSSFDPYTATPDALAEFFVDEIAGIVKSTSAAEIPGDVVLSIDLDLLLTGTRMTDGDRSVKRYILDNSEYITSIRACPECAWDVLEANGVLAGGTNKDRIVFYPFERVPMGMTDAEGLTAQIDPEVVERHVEPTQQAPLEWHQTKDLRKIIPLFKCVTPTIINYPGALKYVDVAKRP